MRRFSEPLLVEGGYGQNVCGKCYYSYDSEWHTPCYLRPWCLWRGKKVRCWAIDTLGVRHVAVAEHIRYLRGKKNTSLDKSCLYQQQKKNLTSRHFLTVSCIISVNSSVLSLNNILILIFGDIFYKKDIKFDFKGTIRWGYGKIGGGVFTAWGE